jgi:hypothetical protein
MMSSIPNAQLAERLKGRAQGIPANEKAVQDLLESISTGNISNSTGVAIGRNIHMVVNQLNLPADLVAQLLSLQIDASSARAIHFDRNAFTDLLVDKTRDFVGREFVFSAFDHFLKTHRKGYFIIEGDPGMGKSALLAEYVRRTGCIFHFNQRATGIVSAKQFLEQVCAQIIAQWDLPYSSVPPDAWKDGAWLSRLLGEAARKFSTGDRMVIAIDAMDEVDLTGHPEGANILFLPKNLPDSVYILFTLRDVDVPLLVETPQQVLKLLEFAAENRRDVELYIRRSAERPGIKAWIAQQKQTITLAEFVHQLAELSENNFMYLHYVLPALEDGMYQALSIGSLPLGLQGYYDDHWRHMGMTAKPLPATKIRIIYIMCEVRQAVSRSVLASFAADGAVQVNELMVQEVLDEWSQFLHQHLVGGTPHYSVYHGSFRDFLHRKDIVKAAGVAIKDINALIADSLWNSIFTGKKPIAAHT